MPPVMSRPKCVSGPTAPASVAVVLWALVAVAFSGCQTRTGAGLQEEPNPRVGLDYPTLVIEIEKRPATSITDFARARMASLITARIEASPRNPFTSIQDLQPAETATEPKPGPTLVARLTLSRYDQYGSTQVTALDPLFRVKIVGVLDLIDSETGRTLVSRDVARVLGLPNYEDLSGFNQSRSPLSARHGVRIHGLDPVPSKMRLLERAFASAVAREILILAPDRSDVREYQPDPVN